MTISDKFCLDEQIKDAEELARLRRHKSYKIHLEAAGAAMDVGIEMAIEAHALICGRYFNIPSTYYLLFVSPATFSRN